MARTLTYAGRVHGELQRMQPHYVNRQRPVWMVLSDFYGERDWFRGVQAFRLLVDRATKDVSCVTSASIRAKYEETLKSIPSIVSLESFQQDASSVFRAVFHDRTIDHLEALHEICAGPGQLFVTLEDDRIAQLHNEISGILSEIENSESTEIDEFLQNRLKDLRFALEQYQLFGGEGVRNSVHMLLGVCAEGLMLGALPSEVQSNLRRTANLCANALKFMLASAAVGQAVEWSGEKIQGLLNNAPQ